MTETEWQACRYPDLMLEALVGAISREQLVDFVRRCWERVTPYLPRGPHEAELTVIDPAYEAGCGEHPEGCGTDGTALRPILPLPVLNGHHTGNGHAASNG